VDMKLEVVVIPVSDVDKAMDFYQALGWRLDADVTPGLDYRVVQLTPPGSACSVIFGTGASEVFHDASGIFHHAGTQARITGPAPDHASYGSFASFDDPDGNGWLVQEITTRLPGR
jgi:catechol 2,3-dioxygenase-like lactoylglutathione lyase family enzyme